jgi:hypothetical protein
MVIVAHSVFFWFPVMPPDTARVGKMALRLWVKRSARFL